MKLLMIGLTGLGLLGFAPAALAQDAAVAAPIRTFVDSFNKGDTAGAAATMTEQPSIVDEVPPFRWIGKDAFAGWAADLGKDSKAKGITDQNVTIGAATRELIAGDNAYVIVPATYSFKQKGVAMSEVAQMTVTLNKGTSGWKISAFAWTGPDPTPAPAK